MKKVLAGALVLSFLALAVLALPAGVEAKAVAKNKNISNNSWATAKANDNDTINAGATNMFTIVSTGGIVVANTGVNNQSGNKDGNKIKTGDAAAGGSSSTSVNTTTVVVGD